MFVEMYISLKYGDFQMVVVRHFQFSKFGYFHEDRRVAYIIFFVMFSNVLIEYNNIVVNHRFLV